MEVHIRISKFLTNHFQKLYIGIIFYSFEGWGTINTYPHGVDHTFGGPSGPWGVHDEQGMAEWDLFKKQLHALFNGGQEVIQCTATKEASYLI